MVLESSTIRIFDRGSGSVLILIFNP